MPRLPDRFDLWVRKSRECPDPARQVDYVLGALAALTDWHFFNVGTKESPQPAETEMSDGRYLLVFSDPGRIEELLEERPRQGATLPVISIPAAAAMAWCIEQGTGLLVNPGEFAVVVPLPQLKAFHADWSQRRAQNSIGYWIPNMTSEEEDFWQQHGV